MTEPGHQLLQARAGSGGQRAAGMAEIMKMQVRQVHRHAGAVPDRPEVRPPQPAALRPDEDIAPLPRLRELFQVPPQLRHQLGGERDGTAPGPGFRRLRPQASLVRLGQGLDDADLARGQVDVLAPEPGQLTPSQVRERGQQDQRPVPDRHLAAIVKTTGNGTISRSCESSLPAPSILHGFLRTMRSWSAAVVKMACSSR